MMGGVTASLSGFFAIGHRWMLRDATEQRMLTELVPTEEDTRRAAA